MKEAMKPGVPVRKPKKIFYGWWVVAAAATMQCYGSGVWYYGFSPIFDALLKEFGWSRAITSGAFSLTRLEGGIEGPIVGWLIDRIGPRKLALFGGIVFGIGFVLLSRTSELWMLYVLFGGVIAIGYNAGFGHAGSTAVANWFIKKRSRALGLFTLGAGVGGATLVPLIGVLISQYGWRNTVFIIGVVAWLIIVPLSLILRHRPEQYGYLPDGETRVEEQVTRETEVTPHLSVAEKESQPGEINFTWKEALGTATFWLLFISWGARSMAMTSVVLHLVPYLTDIGISPVQAAIAMGLMVLLSIPGRLAFGWLGDKFDKRFLLMATLAISAIGVFIMAHIKSIVHLYIFLVVYGFGYGGAIPVYYAIRGEYFGRKAFATIQGIMQTLLIIPTVVGPVFAGYVYDVTGSYYNAFMLFVLLYVVAVVVIAFAKRPKLPAKLIGGTGA